MRQELEYQVRRWSTLVILAASAAWPISCAVVDWPEQSLRVRILFVAGSFIASSVGLISARAATERKLSAVYQQALFSVVMESLSMRLEVLNPKMPAYRVCVLTAGYRFRIEEGGFPWLRYGRTCKIAVAHGDYRVEELKLQYPHGRWIYGHVLAHNEPILYERSASQTQYLVVSKRYQEATNGIQSSLTVAFYRPSDREQKRPVGVFSIDCPVDAEQSGLHEAAISRAVMDAAKHCGIFIR